MAVASAAQVSAVALGSVIVVLAVAVAATVAVRALRRRLRAARAALLDRAGGIVEQVASPQWWAVQRTRRRLSGAVSAAERAVAAAQRVDAPLGELPLLCRQLRGTSRLVDAELRAAAVSGAQPSRRVMDHVADVARASGDIRAAVEAAVHDTVQPQLEPLIAAVRRECAALATGTRAARRIG